MIDYYEIQQEMHIRAKRIAKKHSSPLSQLIAVRITDHTTIYIKPGIDPEKAKHNFLERYKYCIL